MSGVLSRESVALSWNCWGTKKHDAKLAGDQQSCTGGDTEPAIDRYALPVAPSLIMCDVPVHGSQPGSSDRMFSLSANAISVNGPMADVYSAVWSGFYLYTAVDKVAIAFSSFSTLPISSCANFFCPTLPGRSVWWTEVRPFRPLVRCMRDASRRLTLLSR
jgi:hypothetical protein